MSRISTCLWFDHEAKEAAERYVSLVPNSRILETRMFPEGGPVPAGTVMTVRFSLDGTEYLALNGGSHYTLSPAASIVVTCDTQAEIDRLWDALCEGGQPSVGGWLVDRFGLSWQVVPRDMMEMLGAPDAAAVQRAFAAIMTMQKLDMAAIRKAFEGR